jgi:CRP-like cAMP-binding protein
VGYGDISPVSKNEKIFGVFFFLVSIITFSGVVGSVGEVFASFGEQTATMRHELAQLTQYMRWRSLPAETQKKMKDYVQYFWEQNGDQARKEMTILGAVSKSLRQQVVSHVFGPHLKTAQFLSWLTPHDIAFETVLLHCRTELHAPSDFLFTVGEVAKKVYGLVEGRVALYEALSDEGAYHSFKYMDMLDQQAFGAEEDDGKAPQKSSIDSVQLLERKREEDEPVQFGGSCLVQLAFGPDEPAGKAARLRPYSARCQSHCMVVSLCVDEVKQVMDHYPFLWDEFDGMLQRHGVVGNCAHVPWGGKSGGLGGKTMDADMAPSTAVSVNREADQARYNTIKKEMSYIEERLETLSRNYLNTAKGLPLDDIAE